MPADVCLANYRRALIAWYEATIRSEAPYRGEADTFVRAMAGYYFDPKPIEPSLAGAAMPFGDDLALATQERPLHYIPRPLRLSARQARMLASFQQIGNRCRELILMVNYHRIDRSRIAAVLGEPGGVETISDQLEKCQLLIRENWSVMGLVDPAHAPAPEDARLIERYYTGALEATDRWAVEARLPNDPTFRAAAALREEWAGALIVAGRQDLMEVLQREEARLLQSAVPTDTAPAAAANDVTLSPVKGWLDDFRAPSLMTSLAVVLLCALAYLTYTTFGPAAPTRQAVAHFEPFPNIFTSFDPRTEEERDLQRILYYYDRGDYAAAYDELLPVADAYPAAPLYLGVSALALEQPSRALEWFERIPTGDYYRPFADWYEALSYLSENRKEAARANLIDIVETPDHPYRAKAELLLGQIN